MSASHMTTARGSGDSREDSAAALSEPTVRAATRADALYIANRLRASDLAEILLLRMDPVEAVLHSFDRATWAEVVELNGRPFAIFGICVSQDNPALGLPWMLGTHEMPGMGARFVRSCQPVVDRMRATCPALVNVIHGENRVAQRWLAWLGFRLAHHPPPLQSPFVGFWQAQEGYQHLTAKWLMARGFHPEIE